MAGVLKRRAYRTIIEVDRLNQDDTVEVEGTFYTPKK